METSRNIIASLGPNTNWQSGDVVIVFKPSIMMHPDFNTTFVSSNAIHTARAKQRYTWLTYPDDPAQILGLCLIGR